MSVVWLSSSRASRNLSGALVSRRCIHSRVSLAMSSFQAVAKLAVQRTKINVSFPSPHTDVSKFSGSRYGRQSQNRCLSCCSNRLYSSSFRPHTDLQKIPAAKWRLPLIVCRAAAMKLTTGRAAANGRTRLSSFYIRYSLTLLTD